MDERNEPLHSLFFFSSYLISSMNRSYREFRYSILSTIIFLDFKVCL